MNKSISPITWVGGKSRKWNIIKKYIKPLLNNWNGYKLGYFCDLFTGGASVILNAIADDLSRYYEMNDLNKSLIGFWRYIQQLACDDELDKIVNLSIPEIPDNLEDAKKLYEKQPQQLKFLFDNMLNYGGFEKATWSESRLCQNFTQSKIERLKEAGEILADGDVQIDNVDYRKYVKDVTEINVLPKMTSRPCLIYLDPPYFYNKGKPYKHSEIDFNEFKKCVDKLNDAGYYILISIDNSPFIKELFKDYFIYEDEWKYTSTNSKGNKKCKIGKELFITNFTSKGIK